jgi:hypothetical protein
MLRGKVDELVMSAVIVDRQDRPTGKSWARSRSVSAAQGLKAFGWFVFVFVQARGRTTTIYGYHGLRQTQTAISIRAMLRGGPLLRYETPVSGPPWSIPLEFPVYQWICAAAVKIFGASIEGTSRVVSSLFGAGCVIALSRIHRVLGRPESERHLLEAMAVLSPLLLFWSHTVLIETCSLFLALVWLELALRWVARSGTAPARQRIIQFIGVLIFGVLAGATKATTMFPALVFFGLIVVARLRGRIGEFRLRAPRSKILREHITIGGVGLGPIAGAVWWSYFAEKQRMLNTRTNRDIRSQMFGTSAERLEFHRLGAAATRTLGHTVGSTWIVLFVGVACFVGRRRFRIRKAKSARDRVSPSSTFGLTAGLLAAISAIAFVITPLVLFHVHVVHDYYGVEIAPYLLLAIVFGLSNIRESFPNSIGALFGTLCPMVIAVSSLVTYSHFYGPKDADPMAYHPEMRAAVDKYFGPDDLLIVRGTAFDPSIGYHVDRRIVIQETTPDDVVLLAREFSLLKASGYRAGAIQCGYVFDQVGHFLAETGRMRLGTWNGCTLYAPPKTGS